MKYTHSVVSLCIYLSVLFSSLFIYEKAKYRKLQEKHRLQEKKEQLIQERDTALSRFHLLELHEHSLQDPLWIELVLMEKLGVVPEGSHKVLFVKKRNSG